MSGDIEEDTASEFDDFGGVILDVKLVCDACDTVCNPVMFNELKRKQS